MFCSKFNLLHFLVSVRMLKKLVQSTVKSAKFWTLRRTNENAKLYAVAEKGSTEAEDSFQS